MRSAGDGRAAGRAALAVADYPAYLFDADGTLVYPGGPIPGAPETVAALKRAGRRVVVVSNNSALARAELHAKLVRLGFPFELEEVFSAPVATARFVVGQRSAARVYVLGTAGLRTELRAAGARLSRPSRAEFLVVGHDPRLTYRKLLIATRALLAGSRFVAVNRDGLIAAPEGPYPGCGMVVGALEAATGRSPEVVIGKPGPLILEQAARWLGRPIGDCLYVGDSLSSDLGAARAAGAPCLLVLTGVTDAAAAAAARPGPDYVLPSVAALAPTVRRPGLAPAGRPA